MYSTRPNAADSATINPAALNSAGKSDSVLLFISPVLLQHRRALTILPSYSYSSLAPLRVVASSRRDSASWQIAALCPSRRACAGQLHGQLASHHRRRCRSRLLRAACSTPHPRTPAAASFYFIVMLIRELLQTSQTHRLAARSGVVPRTPTTRSRLAMTVCRRRSCVASLRAAAARCHSTVLPLFPCDAAQENTSREVGVTPAESHADYDSFDRWSSPARA